MDHTNLKDAVILTLIDTKKSVCMLVLVKDLR